MKKVLSILMVVGLLFGISFSTLAVNNEEDLRIEMIGNSFAIEFCNINVDGAKVAAEELGVDLNYNAPQDSTQLHKQVNMLNQAISQRPDAILISAPDSGTISAQLMKAKERNIPVIAYDSPMMDAPKGTVTARVTTDNKAAGELAAKKFMENKDFLNKIKNANTDNPVYISVIAPDAVLPFHTLRTEGFANEMFELTEKYNPGQVEITGHVLFEKASEQNPSVIIQTAIAPTHDSKDLRNTAQTVVNKENMIGIFCINEAAMNGLLNVTSDGLELDRVNGKYKDILVAGFDAGKTLLNAVKEQYVYGAITQDPYGMGYEGLKLAVEASKDEEVKNISTSLTWYNHENMNNPELERNLYK